MRFGLILFLMIAGLGGCQPEPCCTNDADCPEDSFCGEGACAWSCSSNDDCYKDELCIREKNGPSNQGLCIRIIGPRRDIEGVCTLPDPINVMDSGTVDGAGRDAGGTDAGEACAPDVLEPNDDFDQVREVNLRSWLATLCVNDVDVYKPMFFLTDGLLRVQSLTGAEGDGLEVRVLNAEYEVVASENGEDVVLEVSAGRAVFLWIEGRFRTSNLYYRVSFADHDAGVVDAGLDSGVVDAGLDSGVVDAGLDSGIVDAGLDSGVSDSGVVDAGLDSGVVDAGLDSGVVDAGLDSGVSDSGVVDAGLDSGVVDAGLDSGIVDAGLDSGVVDAGLDSGVVDAGLDSGVVDAGLDSGVVDAGTGCSLHFEPNDQFAVEFPVGGGPQTAAICSSSDVDLYLIEIEERSRFSLRMRFQNAVGDLDVRLLTEGGQQIDSSQNVTDEESIQRRLEPGSYIVEVYGFQGAQGPYSLEIQVEPDVFCVNDNFEPNNRRRRATSLPAPDFEGILCVGDSDYYRLDVPQGALVSIQLLYIASPSLNLSVQRRDGTEVASSFTGDGQENIEFIQDRNETLYLLIAGSGTATGQRYSLQVTLRNNCLEDAYAPNDSPFGAPQLSIPSEVEGTLCRTDEADFFSVRAASTRIRVGLLAQDAQTVAAVLTFPDFQLVGTVTAAQPTQLFDVRAGAEYSVVISGSASTSYSFSIQPF